VQVSAIHNLISANQRAAKERLENYVRRMPEVCVGDFIQYRYRSSSFGTSLTTEAVIEVLDGGALFVVKGFYNVNASQVVAHIPMHEEAEDDDWWCGVRE
jgi:hypothetical protein